MDSPVDSAVQNGQDITGSRTVYPLVPQPHGGALRPGGPGRPKGSLAPWSKKALKQIETVWRRLGGIEAMTTWASDNPSDFYKLWGRLLPSQATVDHRHRMQSDPANMTDADLLRIVELASRPAILSAAGDKARDMLAMDAEPVEPEPVVETKPKPAPVPRGEETEAQLRERLGLPPGPAPWAIESES